MVERVAVRVKEGILLLNRTLGIRICTRIVGLGMNVLIDRAIVSRYVVSVGR